MADADGRVQEPAVAEADVARAPAPGPPGLATAGPAGPVRAVLAMQSSAGNRATVQWLARARTLARRTWHQERAEELRSALKTDPATWDEPGGVFYRLNGLNTQDQVKVLSALSSADRKLIEDNLHNSKLDRAAMYQSLQQANTGSDWWGKKSSEIHAAIRKGDFVTYPTGAYWIINPLNDDDRVKIMKFLGADHLDALIDHEEKAIDAGVPNAASIAVEARNARAKRREKARDPLQVMVPGTWVDDFKEVVYDIDYRIAEGGSPSNWMQVHYKDGTKIDLNWYDFDDVKLSGAEVSEAFKNRFLGPGGRVFPKRAAKHQGRLGLTRQLCPRLWAMREEVENIGAQSTIELMTLSLHAVLFVLTMPAMPVGPAPVGAGAAPRVTRRTVTRGSSPSKAPPASTAPKPDEPPPPKALPEKGTRQKPTFDWKKAPSDEAGMGHLDYRHAPWSKAEGTSKFNQQTWNNLKAHVEETVEQGTIGTLKPDAAGRPQAGAVYEKRFPNPVGLDKRGKQLYRIRVVVDPNNHVTTTFPF